MAFFAFNIEAPNEIIVCANTKDQASARAFRELKGIISRNPALKAEVVRWTEDRIELANGTIVSAIPSDSTSQAGANHGFILVDEIWGYIHESDIRFHEEMTLPPTRISPVRFTTSYAGFPGESVLEEDIYHRFLDKDGNPHPGVTMPLPGLPCYALGEMFMYWDHEPRMPWQTPQYYEEQRRVLRPATFDRIHRNMCVSGDERLLSLDDINAAIVPGHGPCFEGNPGFSYYAGLDLGLKRDRSALAVIHKQDGRIILDHLRIFEPPRHGEVDLSEVQAHVTTVAKAFRLQKLLMDPWNSAHLRQALGKDCIPVEDYHFSSQTWGKLAMGLLSAFKDRVITIFPDEELIRELSTCRIVETSNGVKISNPSGQHDDATTALALAIYGCMGQPEGSCDIQAFEGIGAQLLGSDPGVGVQESREPLYDIKSRREKAEGSSGIIAVDGIAGVTFGPGGGSW